MRISLDKEDEDRYLWLAPPSAVELVAGRGVRITTRAKLQWDVIGIPVPITMRSVSVLLLPSIERRDGHDALVFRGELEEADLTLLPSFVEGSLVDLINAKLSAPDTALPWNFIKTLDFTFTLPDTIQPLKTLRLHALAGSVEVGTDALTLGVTWGLDAALDAAYPHEVPRELADDGASSLH